MKNIYPELALCGRKISVLGLILSSSPYLRSAKARFPFHFSYKQCFEPSRLVIRSQRTKQKDYSTNVDPGNLVKSPTTATATLLLALPLPLALPPLPLPLPPPCTPPPCSSTPCSSLSPTTGTTLTRGAWVDSDLLFIMLSAFFPWCSSKQCFHKGPSSRCEQLFLLIANVRVQNGNHA